MFPKRYQIKMGYDYLEPGTKVTFDRALTAATIHYGEIVKFDEITGAALSETEQDKRIKKCAAYKTCNNLVCRKKGLKMKYCVGCRNGSMGKRFYCSRKCQKIHWISEHKQYCEIYR